MAFYRPSFESVEQDFLREFIALVHNDIYVKSPRGQVAKGQKVQLKRHLALLELADKVREYLREVDNDT